MDCAVIKPMIRPPRKRGYVMRLTFGKSVQAGAVVRHCHQALGAEFVQAALEVGTLRRVLGEGDRAAVGLGGFVVAAGAA